MKIAILGAGRVGLNLLAFLEKMNYEITVVDSDSELCDTLASESRALIINGDCSDPDVLDSLKLGEADYVFAVSGKEEVNFLSAIYAKHAGAKNVVARSEAVQHTKLLGKLGIKSLVPEVTLARELANQIINPTIFKMLTPGESNINLFEVTIPAKLNEKTIAEATKEPEVDIIAIFEGNKFVLPQPTDVLKEGQKAIVVGSGGRRHLA